MTSIGKALRALSVRRFLGSWLPPRSDAAAIDSLVSLKTVSKKLRQARLAAAAATVGAPARRSEDWAVSVTVRLSSTTLLGALPSLWPSRFLWIMERPPGNMSGSPPGTRCGAVCTVALNKKTLLSSVESRRILRPLPGHAV